MLIRVSPRYARRYKGISQNRVKIYAKGRFSVSNDCLENSLSHQTRFVETAIAGGFSPDLKPINGSHLGVSENNASFAHLLYHLGDISSHAARKKNWNR